MLLKYLHWLVLFLACLLLFGNYYCYDIPGALSTQLREWFNVPHNEWQYQLNALYTAYSMPNLIMPVVGGMLVDRLGATRMLLMFGVLVVAGMSLFSAGVQLKAYWMMLVGRAMFGIGGESLEVAQAQITTDWFRHRSLGLALGLNLTMARLATALNDVVSPYIQQHLDINWASWFGTITCVASLFCGILLVMLNRDSIRNQCGVWTAGKTDRSAATSPSLNGSVANADVESQYSTREASVASDTKLIDEHIGSWRDITSLPASFWVLCLSVIALYGAVNPFIHILSDYLQEEWYPGDPQTAGAVMALPDLVSAVGSPICGYLLDWCTHRAAKSNNKNAELHVRYAFLPISGLLLMSVHIMMGFTRIDPKVVLTILGIAYSFFGAALWPMVPYLVKNPRLVGTAYGVSTVALNLSLSVVPLIVARIFDTGSYAAVELWFISLAALGTVLGIVVAMLDYRTQVVKFIVDDASSVDKIQVRRPLLQDDHMLHVDVSPNVQLSEDECDFDVMPDHHLVGVPKRTVAK